jgi:hypothetical protein
MGTFRGCFSASSSRSASALPGHWERLSAGRSIGRGTTWPRNARQTVIWAPPDGPVVIHEGLRRSRDHGIHRGNGCVLNLTRIGWMEAWWFAPDSGRAHGGFGHRFHCSGRRTENVFACRSAGVWPGTLGWRSNRFLVLTVSCGAVMLLGFTYIPQLARILGQAPPKTAGYLMALLAIPAVFSADSAHKRWKGRHRI